ncbi:MAG: HAD-IIB family hydrolase [Patescibacteria group bacterium]
MKLKIIIFTDLDGTLLDHKTYSFKKALPALKKIKKTETPVVFVTSKTFAEVKTLQKKMNLWKKEAFIIEGGGAIFIPENLFDFVLKTELSKEKISKKQSFWKIEFGKPYSKIQEILKETARKINVPIKGIGDMTAEEFSKDCGLPLGDAKEAKKRTYQEGFKILLPKKQQQKMYKKIKSIIQKKGFYMAISGRYYQIMGKPAKIKAVKILMRLFQKKYGKIYTIGFGDSQADLEFIKFCDEGYLIKNPKKLLKTKIKNPKIKKTENIGPKAWNEIVLRKIK